MRKKNSLLFARIIQWISGTIAVIVIYPIFGLIYPCWHRINSTWIRRETDAPGETDASSDTSGSRTRYSPSGKSIPQSK